MPKTFYILIANQKGGVGKTTIADELAFALERRGFDVAFYNLDNQGGCIHTRKNVDDDTDFAIIDTPGAINPEFRELCQMAHMVIIPSKPSMQDLSAFNRTWKIATEGVKSPTGSERIVGTVVNLFDGRRKVDNQWVEFLHNAGYPVFAIIPETTVFTTAVAMRKSVCDCAPRSKACTSIEMLTDRVLQEVSNGR